MSFRQQFQGPNGQMGYNNMNMSPNMNNAKPGGMEMGGNMGMNVPQQMGNMGGIGGMGGMGMPQMMPQMGGMPQQMGQMNGLSSGGMPQSGGVIGGMPNMGMNLGQGMPQVGQGRPMPQGMMQQGMGGMQQSSQVPMNPQMQPPQRQQQMPMPQAQLIPQQGLPVGQQPQKTFDFPPPGQTMMQPGLTVPPVQSHLGLVAAEDARPEAPLANPPSAAESLAEMPTLFNGQGITDLTEIMKNKREPKTAEELNLRRFVTKDLDESSTLPKKLKQEADKLNAKRYEISFYHSFGPIRSQEPQSIFQDGYLGYGNGWTGLNTRFVYPRDRKKHNRNTRDLVLSRQQLNQQASEEELLVPIRLDFDLGRLRLRDTFMWNVNEKTFPVHFFVENMFEDFHFPHQYIQSVSNSISEQLQDFQPHQYPQEARHVIGNGDVTRNEDMRVVVRLDITVGQHNLIDQFEWDINDSLNSPEEFAAIMCAELSLSGEFATAIAHAIHEQTQVFSKSLLLLGHTFDQRPVDDEDIRREICAPLPEGSIMRPKNNVNEYSPALFEISEAELSRLDKDKDRDSRQKRRQGRAGRRGAPSLPDFKKVVRTFRTPVYSAVLPGAVDRKVELAKQALQAEEEEEEEDSDGNVVMRPVKRQRTTGRHVPMRAAAANAAVAVAAQSQELEATFVEELADPTSFWVTLKVPPQQLARLMMVPRFG